MSFKCVLTRKLTLGNLHPVLRSVLNSLSSQFQGQQINEAACDLAREVANEGDAMVAGGVSQTPSYLSCKSEDEVKAIFKKQLDVFVKKNVDFLIAEV